MSGGRSKIISEVGICELQKVIDGFPANTPLAPPNRAGTTLPIFRKPPPHSTTAKRVAPHPSRCKARRNLSPRQMADAAVRPIISGESGFTLTNALAVIDSYDWASQPPGRRAFFPVAPNRQIRLDRGSRIIAGMCFL